MEINEEIKEVQEDVTRLRRDVDMLFAKVIENPFSSGKKIKCLCGYRWKTKSNAFRVSCPNCGSKVLNKK